MNDQIGETAGKAWQYLETNRAATIAQIQKGIGANAAQTNQAIGWLAREGKLHFERCKRAVKVSLRP